MSFFSNPKVIFCRKMIVGILFWYLVLYVIAYTRYQISILVLDNKITRLFILSAGKNSEFPFERLSSLQLATVPTEPMLYNPLSVWKSFNSKYDEVGFSKIKYF